MWWNPASLLVGPLCWPSPLSWWSSSPSLSRLGWWAIAEIRADIYDADAKKFILCKFHSLIIEWNFSQELILSVGKIQIQWNLPNVRIKLIASQVDFGLRLLQEDLKNSLVAWVTWLCGLFDTPYHHGWNYEHFCSPPPPNPPLAPPNLSNALGRRCVPAVLRLPNVCSFPVYNMMHLKI